MILKIQILVDNLRSWINEYAKNIFDELKKIGHEVRLISKHQDVEKGDILFLLGCEKIFENLNSNNIVVHESDLPLGKGWSPLSWQILEGKREIPITLFEANEGIDSGDIYSQKIMSFEGHELLDELKHKQGIYTKNLIIEFVKSFPNIKSQKQIGVESFYKKRGQDDSELDVNKTISQQFNLLRIVDNDRYPAFFKLNGFKYKIEISKYD